MPIAIGSSLIILFFVIFIEMVNTDESLKISKKAGDYFGVINEQIKTYNAKLVAKIPTTCWV